MKYRLYITLLSLLSVNYFFAQNSIYDDWSKDHETKVSKIEFCENRKVKQFKKNYFFDDIFGTLGFGVGQEYFFGLKGSLIKPFSFVKNRGKSRILTNNVNKHSGFYPLGGYVSIDPNMFVFFAGWVGVGLNVGVSLPFVTVDNSIVVWAISGPSGEEGYGRVTYNPKIGVYVGPVWFKVGPSFILAQKKEFAPDLIKINDTNFNFELSYIAEF